VQENDVEGGCQMSAFVEIKHLKKFFYSQRGALHAVDDISMNINRGETMGVVGESGCGKSTLGRTVINLLDKTDGDIFFDNRDITRPTRREMKKLRQELQIIFQDPYSSLNPRLTVEQTIMEPLKLHLRLSRKEMTEKCEVLMGMVGIDKRLRLSYPHELDGGRRQRVGIARALSLDPKFIVCDEPVSALDVSIQAQILNLLMDLQEKYGLTYMFITHNMAVVRHVSHNISVMYLGNLVEASPTDDLFDHPLHPYTKALLSAIPTIDIMKKPETITLKGEISSPINPKPGCRFAPRCVYAGTDCSEAQNLEELAPGHYVACCRARELNGLR
jgi:peptide/nickel transport system ATP-binding protein